MTDRPVCVIITARNAQQTIADAVRTALDQPEVGQVIVVDDASTDQTAAASESAATGDARLVVLRRAQNGGPSAGRNMALDHTDLPFVAVLDADDYLLPGRFARLLAEPDWDMIADNIHFIDEDTPGLLAPGDVPQADSATDLLDLAGFVRGNIARPSVSRGELGFLKPMMSRAFLAKHGLRYAPDLWLGEDFHLYVRMLAKGARFRVSRQIGYVARVRHNSLSGKHKTKDLAALLQASEQTLLAPQAAMGASAPVLHDYIDQLRNRYLLRAFLDCKAQRGLTAAAGFALRPASNLAPILRGVASDKIRTWTGRRDPSPVGTSLLPTRSVVPLA
jgi:succinoglycan biosynthesis protein ExoU